MSTTRSTAPRIEIQTEVQYMPEDSDPDASIYAFAYTVTILHKGGAPAQLISRHWIIESADGMETEVNGLGVIGQQPMLHPGEKYRYTSGCRIGAPSGRMHGSYFFVTEEAERHDISIPAFELEMPRTLH